MKGAEGETRNGVEIQFLGLKCCDSPMHMTGLDSAGLLTLDCFNSPSTSSSSQFFLIFLISCATGMP